MLAKSPAAKNCPEGKWGPREYSICWKRRAAAFLVCLEYSPDPCSHSPSRVRCSPDPSFPAPLVGLIAFRALGDDPQNHDSPTAPVPRVLDDVKCIDAPSYRGRGVGVLAPAQSGRSGHTLMMQHDALFGIRQTKKQTLVPGFTSPIFTISVVDWPSCNTEERWNSCGPSLKLLPCAGVRRICGTSLPVWLVTLTV